MDVTLELLADFALRSRIRVTLLHGDRCFGDCGPCIVIVHLVQVGE